MSQHQSNADQSQPPQPKFDPNAPHHARPKVRGLRGFPVEVQNPQGQKGTMLGLADARQISDKMVVTAPAAQFVMPLLDGTRELPEIVAQVGRGLNLEILQQLVAQLDDAALIEGPTFQALLAKTRAEFDASDTLPPGSSAQFADAAVSQAIGAGVTEQQKAELGPKKMGELFDQWMATALQKAANPSFNELPKAIVAPHLDYGRGWPNYACTYGRLRVCDRPDRVIVLGTNHFGSGTGVVGCNKSYETPLGVAPLDKDVEKGLRSRLGDKLFEHRFDHEREHSIELHVPWIQHVFGKNDAGEFPRVFGALIHDPTVNNGESYDGNGVSLDAFVNALKETIKGLPGRTLVVSSADLSHAGPAFGDQQPLAGEAKEAEEARNKIVQHDLQMLDLIKQNKSDELLTSMAWQQNPTRWCSIGNLVATLRVVEPGEVELLNYSAAIDQQGMTFVSSAALAMR